MLIRVRGNIVTLATWVMGTVALCLVPAAIHDESSVAAPLITAGIAYSLSVLSLAIKSIEEE